MPDKPRKHTHKNKDAKFYEISQRDLAKIMELKEQLCTLCRELNLPSFFLVQTRHAETDYGILGFNYADGKRTADAFYTMSLILQWLQSDSEEAKNNFAKIMALTKLIDNGAADGPLAMFAAMAATAKGRKPSKDA